MQVTTLGIGLAKKVFKIHGIDEHGKVILKKPLKRALMEPYFINLPPCLIGTLRLAAARITGHANSRQWGTPCARWLHSSSNHTSRLGRCEGDLRSRRVPEHALCTHQKCRATGRSITSLSETGIREGSHGARQSDTRPSCRIREHPSTRHQQ